MLRFYCLTAAQLALALSSTSASAQDDGSPDTALQWGNYSLASPSQPDRVSVTKIDGADVLTVTRSTAMLDGVDFSEGVIEFDVAFEGKFGFGGLLWHANGRDAEYFYLRQHKSGDPDAGQYTPIRNGLTSWQLYTDRNGIAPFAFTHEGWNHFKMVVAGDKADIYFNGGPMPVLHIPDLAADQGSGGIGFRASGPNGELRFANLVIRPLADGEGIIGVPASDRTAPEGTIPLWSVSERFAESRVAGQIELPPALASLATIGTVEVEPFGIADITRLAGPDNDADTVIVATRIVSDAPRPVRLRFGYSDRVRLFLNGRLVFEGSAGWRSRDHFFLGTIGFEDAVVLNLREGENVLSAAVSETFGGWGFAGAIADRAGLTIMP